MGSAIRILETLTRLGVHVMAVGPDRLRIEPASKVPADLIPRIREAKPEILRALAARPVTCSPSCYEIGPGRWIHHPWDDCQSSMPKLEPSPQVEATCWHCQGSGRCGCSTCWRPYADAQSECAVCKASGKVLRWIQ